MAAFVTFVSLATSAVEVRDLPLPKTEIRNDWQIVPGLRVGLIRIGMPIQDVLSLLGKLNNILGYVGILSYQYGDLVVEANVHQGVTRINTESVNYRTKDGLGVGSTEADIHKKAMGLPTCKTKNSKFAALACKEGVSFILRANRDRVSQVAIRSEFDC